MIIEMKELIISVLLLFSSVYSNSQNCECPDYLFSTSGDEALMSVGSKNNKLLICGYHDHELGNGYISGKMQKDSLMYLCGFSIFICQDSIISLTNYSYLLILDLNINSSL